MRRFEVYFLQKKIDGVWDTLERAQSVSVLVSSLVREFDARDDAEVRVLAGTYNESSEDWEFTQIFFVDRTAIELALSEHDDDDAGFGTGLDDEPAPVPGGQDFADAIHRASDDGDATETRIWSPRAMAARDDDDPLDDDVPVGPPPSFRPARRRSGQVFFVIGTVLIALMLTGAAILALGIAFDLPQIRPLVSTFQELTGGMTSGDATATSSADEVKPETTGQVVTYRGVAPSLRGRWSPGRCDESYIEFDADGLVVGTPGRPESLKVPVVETLEDDYTWFVRRSPDLVEHFQKLGSNDLQLVGDTTRSGFMARTSDILTRCP
ncbi:hypothetical protein [Thalassobaculum sp.]|uniref:hypothetical protein n=1 Tax=Thalassobaculum sp. TaxID=2022740 RepID=UPI0032EB94C8